MCQSVSAALNGSRKSAKAVGLGFNPAKNHELVRMNLDIGQCRYIQCLLSKEFLFRQANALPDKNNALEQLLDQFERYAFRSPSTPIHQDDSLNRWIDENDPEEINALLQKVYVEGQLHVD